MNRYENGKIYRIIDVGYAKCYVGSTCESLSKRMTRHREKFMAYQRGNKREYATSFLLFEEFGIENCKIELLENFPCSSREELLQREGGYIQAFVCVNKVIPIQAVPYYWRHRDEVLEKQLEKVQCPLCQGWFSKNYLKIHKQTKKAHPDEKEEEKEEQWNVFNNKICYWKDFRMSILPSNVSKFHTVFDAYVGLAVMRQVWFTSQGTSAVWTLEGRIFEVFCEVTWV